MKARGRRWAVQREDAQHADSIHDTQEAAIARAIDLSQRASGRLRVKGRDGRLQHEQTFCLEPAPPNAPRVPTGF